VVRCTPSFIHAARLEKAPPVAASPEKRMHFVREKRYKAPRPALSCGKKIERKAR
jgi:hypothetical protein